MNKKSKYTYDLEFKQESVKLATTSNQPIEQTAKNLGVSVSTLRAWIKKYAKPQSSNILNLQADNKKLKKKLALMEKERDILKKAAAYFANETL